MRRRIGLLVNPIAEIGAASIDELLAQIPAEHRLKRPLALPAGLRAEADLRRRMTAVLAKNRSCEELLSFLGAGAGSITCRRSSTRSSAVRSS